MTLSHYKDKNLLENFTLKNFEDKMYEIGFTQALIDDLMIILEIRFYLYGERNFQKWFSLLHYMLSDEFKDEIVATKLYKKHARIIE